MLRVKQVKSDIIYVLYTFKSSRKSVVFLQDIQRKSPYLPVLLHNEKTGEEYYVPIFLVDLNWKILKTLNDYSEE